MNEGKTTTFGAYSPVYRAGDYYYVSGQVGVDSKTKQAPAGLETQVEIATGNLSKVLKTAGLGYENIVKTTLYLVDIDDFTSVNVVYGKYFLDPKPARSAVVVKELPKVGGDNKILFEIEAVAFKEEE